MPENDEIKNDSAEKGSGSQPDTSALFDLLGKLLANRPSGQTEDQASGAAANQGAQTQTTGNFGASVKDEQNAPRSSGEGDILSSLLSNPDLLSKLPQILSVAGPLFGGNAHKSGNEEHESKQTSASSSSPASKGSKEADCRAALLCAMKPYLGKERQNAIDYMIKLSRLGDILKTL